MNWEFRAPTRTQMDYASLRQFVRKGEGAQLEFKLKNNHPEKILRELVAFANTNGGILLLGVSDDKEIKGLKFGEEDDFILQKFIHSHISPPLSYENERFILPDEREVLIYHIPSSSSKPHFVTFGEPEPTKKAYIRVKDRSIQASKEVKNILKGKSKSLNIKFNYGPKEQILMSLLEKNGFTTLEAFKNAAAIPKKIASDTLVRLVLANLLSIEPSESEDIYKMVKI